MAHVSLQGSSQATSKGVARQQVYHGLNCAVPHWNSHCNPIKTHFNNFIEASVFKNEALICWHVGILLYPCHQLFLSHLTFVTPLSLTLLLFLGDICPPFSSLSSSCLSVTSRSLYRNRSFLRIPLAARPRFSSLRSLRFVFPQCYKQGNAPHPSPKFTCFIAVK